MTMTCIACKQHDKELANSHVIPNFIKKRLTGDTTNKRNTKYKFQWINQPELPKQDLPKPQLMCKSCDNKLGSIVEGKVPLLLMPQLMDSLEEWEKLPIEIKALNNIFEDSFYVGVYNYPELEMELLKRFSISIAWRALHAMSKEGRRLSGAFLNSKRGLEINNKTIDYIFNNISRGTVPLASLYYLGPNTARNISGYDDQMPFAWAELGEGDEILGVGVLFGYWIVLWPLFNEEDYIDKNNKLKQICFINWVGQIRSDLNPSSHNPQI